MLNTNIPLSGMQAATVRLTAAANNIANVNSNGALPAAGQTPPAASQTPVSGQTAANPQAYSARAGEPDLGRSKQWNGRHCAHSFPVLRGAIQPIGQLR